MPDVWKDPTAEQAEQALLVQHDLVEVMNRLAREGIDPRIILAGAGSAISDLIVSQFGLSAVPGWFATNARLTADAIGACDS